MAKISVVDDSQATIDMLVSILESSQHTVTAFSDSVAVEQKIAAEQPDIILLDVVMPERNGYEVLRALKRSQDTKDIPVILVSSKNEMTDIRWGLRQGAAGYVAKPFTEQALLGAIAEQV